jgi:hypothetical protein
MPKKEYMQMSSRLLINEHPLQVLPSLATLLGLNEAIILQQIQYWISMPTNTKIIEGRKWTYNTFGQWKIQFPFWSISTIKRSVEKLKELKVLISKEFNAKNGDRTKWYSIDYERLDSFIPCTQSEPSPIVSNCNYGSVKLTRCIEEAETTSETNNNNKAPEQPLAKATTERADIDPAPVVVCVKDLGKGKELTPLEAELRAMGMSDPQITQCLARYGDNYVKEKLDITKKANPDNAIGFFRKALADNYRPSEPQNLSKAQQASVAHAPSEAETLRMLQEKERGIKRTVDPKAMYKLMKAALKGFPNEPLTC